MAGGVETRSVHVHHLVWGIGLMLLSGFLAFSAPLERRGGISSRSASASAPALGAIVADPTATP